MQLLIEVSWQVTSCGAAHTSHPVFCLLCSVGSLPLTCLTKMILTVSKQTPTCLTFTHPMISGNSLYVTLKKRARWLPGFTLQPKSDKGLASGVSHLCSCCPVPLSPMVFSALSGGHSLEAGAYPQTCTLTCLNLAIWILKLRTGISHFPPHSLPTRQQ